MVGLGRGLGEPDLVRIGGKGALRTGCIWGLELKWVRRVNSRGSKPPEKVIEDEIRLREIGVDYWVVSRSV